MPITERMRLITNLDFVTCGIVRTYCHALVLETSTDLFDREKPSYRIRGFGVEAAIPVFDIFVKSVEYESAPAASPDVFIGCKGDARPLMQGAIFRFAEGGPELHLITQSHRHPLDVEDFETTYETRGVGYDRLWDALIRKVAKYWDAPNMPTMRWMPAAAVRRALELAPGRHLW